MTFMMQHSHHPVVFSIHLSISTSQHNGRSSSRYTPSGNFLYPPQPRPGRRCWRDYSSRVRGPSFFALGSIVAGMCRNIPLLWSDQYTGRGLVPQRRTLKRTCGTDLHITARWDPAPIKPFRHICQQGSGATSLSVTSIQRVFSTLETRIWIQSQTTTPAFPMEGNNASWASMKSANLVVLSRNPRRLLTILGKRQCTLIRLMKGSSPTGHLLIQATYKRARRLRQRPWNLYLPIPQTRTQRRGNGKHPPVREDGDAKGGAPG